MDSESEDISEGEMEDSDQELDRRASGEDSDASPTGFRLVDVKLLTVAISHTRFERCKDDKLVDGR